MGKKELKVADILEKLAELTKRQEETDRRLQLLEEEKHWKISNIGYSDEDFAVKFFYDSLKENMTFAGINFDCMDSQFNCKKILPGEADIGVYFDIVLRNDNSIILIEIKDMANLKDLKELVEKKVPNFRLLFPEFAKYKLYLGIGSLVLKERIVQEAEKLGIGLMRQQGNAVEYKTDWVRAY